MTATDRDSAEARVDRVFLALGRMGEGDLIELRAQWEGGDVATRERAWSKVHAMLRHDPRSRDLDEARDRLATWATGSGISWGGAFTRLPMIPGGLDVTVMRRDAVPPLVDAIAAMLMEDALNDDERETLLMPLRSVTEQDFPAG